MAIPRVVGIDRFAQVLLTPDIQQRIVLSCKREIPRVLQVRGRPDRDRPAIDPGQEHTDQFFPERLRKRNLQNEFTQARRMRRRFRRPARFCHALN